MMPTTEKVRRPALRYHGGKFGVHGTTADWIISHLPRHEHYVEPFSGGASVLLRKPPSKLETYNDLDEEVVTFFRVLRERPDDLIQMIELTPWSRVELHQAREPVEGEGPEADLEMARRVFVRSWMGRGKTSMQTAPGWRYEVQAKRGTRPYSDVRTLRHLEVIADRLSRVQIECDDALNACGSARGRRSTSDSTPSSPANPAELQRPRRRASMAFVRNAVEVAAGSLPSALKGLQAGSDPFRENVTLAATD